MPALGSDPSVDPRHGLAPSLRNGPSREDDPAAAHAAQRAHTVQPRAVSGAARGGTARDWLMPLLCLPMLALIVVLLGTGAAGAAAVFIAVVCLGVMAVLMTLTHRGH